MAYQNVPNEPHIYYNLLPDGSTVYYVDRAVKQKRQYLGGITSLPEAIKVRDEFVVALPAGGPEQGIKLRKKNKHIKELQKATRWFYKRGRGEVSYPNYLDLVDQAELRKIRTNVMRGTTPGKFSKLNMFTPLKPHIQKKILKYFPEADFDLWKKGFDAVNDTQRYSAVNSFISRGYKPAFWNVKDLPKKTQELIIEAFGKEAEAAGTPLKFGPGRKFGVSQKQNLQLNTQITGFLNNMGKKHPYAFSTLKPENWIITQMHRAADANNPDYKVLTDEKTGKIIGASEKGVKYYHANSKNINNLITNHPEAEQISKFVTVAREAKADIPTSLLKIFPKGFDRNLLNTNRAYTDLLQWLDNTQGRRRVANAINVHHAGEGAVAGNPALARDLQLLTAGDNIDAANIKMAIENNKDFSRVPELKEKGIRLNVGGVEYGAGPETETAGLKRIEKASLSRLQTQLKIDSELGGFVKFLGQEIVGLAKTNVGGSCAIPSLAKKAEGGRIGFAAGSNCARQMEVAFAENPTKVIQEVSELPGNKSINKIKNAATGFLNLAKKGGKFGAIAAAGAASAALVKTFMNDDPTTYLSDENQQKNMLIEMVTSPMVDQPDSTPEILDWQLPVLGATAAAGTAAVAPSTIEASRSARFGKKPSGYTKTALKTLGRGLAATGTPLGLAAFEPLHIAGQVEAGDSLGEIATNPWNYAGLAFADDLSKFATKGLSPGIAKAMRLGISPAALRVGSRFLGLPGLALSLGISGYEMYDDYKKKRGWFSEE